MRKYISSVIMVLIFTFNANADTDLDNIAKKASLYAKLLKVTYQCKLVIGDAHYHAARLQVMSYAKKLGQSDEIKNRIKELEQTDPVKNAPPDKCLTMINDTYFELQ